MLLHAVVLTTVVARQPQRHDSFRPGEVWTDTEGNTIDAHGAGLLSHDGTTYWYGTKRQGHPNVAKPGTYPRYSAYCYPPAPDGLGAHAGDGFTEGVNLYSSDGDLYNWKHQGLVFAANKTGAHCLERPKVIRCPGTGKFVLWAKGFTPVKSQFNGTKVAVVATADMPLGPFELAGGVPFYAPGGNAQMADATLHVDSKNESAWLYWRSPNVPPLGPGFFVARLSADCTRLAERQPPKLIASIKHEAPAVFQAGGRTYIWTSSTTGFAANPAHLLVSNSGALEGPFVEAGNPTHNVSSFDSQSTFVLPNPAWNASAASEGLARFIYLADRWETKTEQFGRYLWLPLVVDTAAPNVNDSIEVTNPPTWRYDAPVP